MELLYLLFASAFLQICASAPDTHSALDVDDAEDIPIKSRQFNCELGYHVIATRGASTSHPPYGGLYTTVANYTEAVAFSDAVPNRYPSANQDHLKAITKGTKNLKADIRDFVAQCPNTRVVLLGYSQGAIVMMNALCGFVSADGKTTIAPIHSKYAKNIIAAVGYGDESRVAGQSYNRGSCKNNGLHPRAHPDCGKFRPIIRSYCDAPDPQCCEGGLELIRHSQYPDLYDRISTNYVKRRYKASTGIIGLVPVIGGGGRR